MFKSIGLLAIAAAIAYSPSVPAAAQGTSQQIEEFSSQTTKLRRGVYTTPEVSAKCDTYARSKAGGGSEGDRTRDALFAACVRKFGPQAKAKR
jgi:hypothetical protein